jgi:two-component system NtrC family sensor kinase
MKNIFHHPEKSLAAKLIIAIGLLMAIGSFVFWYAILKKQEQDVMSIASKYSNAFMGFTMESIGNTLADCNQEKTQQTLERLSIPEGVHRVRIYKHDGTVFFSSDKKDIGFPVDKTTIACKGCHFDAEKSPELLPELQKIDKYKHHEGFTAIKLVEPIYNKPDCYTAACHVHTGEQKILGFVEADLSLALLDEALFKQGLALTAYVFIFIIAASTALGIILYKIVSKPVSELAHGMGNVASGNFDYVVPVKSVDELGVLANTFNSMIKDIKAARDQRELWTLTLESEIAKQTEEIQKTYANLAQTEKLASLGRMAAGVAHEINNPLTGVVTFAHLMLKRSQPNSQDAEDLNIIIEQTERCAKIIKNLLSFARATPSEKGKVAVNEVLSRTIYMVKNQEKFLNIDFNVNMDKSALISIGDASQFQQICLNMLINAADAMNERGTITITTRKITVNNKPFVEIEFTDTGCGIKEEDMPKLFEPFFTTKPVDKGTGLGLSVSHGIVKHAGGDIKVKSTAGKGTSFFIRLPLLEEKA